MLGKSFPYGESVFIHSYLLFSVVFIKEPQDDDDYDDDDDDVVILIDTDAPSGFAPA